MMVEVFCGILAGAAVGPDIRKWQGDDRVANLVSILSLLSMYCFVKMINNPCIIEERTF